MSKRRGDAPDKEGGKPQQEPGRLELDERGNVTWQWSDDAELQADDEIGQTQRLRALNNPTLDLVEDDDPKGAIVNATGIFKGYDPYHSGALAKDSWKKKKDLRGLSRWIELRRKIDTESGASGPAAGEDRPDPDDEEK